MTDDARIRKLEAELDHAISAANEALMTSASRANIMESYFQELMALRANLTALIAKWQEKTADCDEYALKEDDVEACRRWTTRSNIYLVCADQLAALLQAAAPPAPTAEPDEHRRLKYSQMDLDAQTKPLHVEIERLKVEHTRAILHYTVKGYTAGENTDAKHWRLRAEEAESKLAAAPPERVSEGKEP